MEYFKSLNLSFKCKYFFAFLAIIFFIPKISQSEVSLNYVYDRSIIRPPYGEIPLKGEVRKEPITGAEIIRRSDISDTNGIASKLGVVYSRYSPTNSTGEYFLAHGDDSFSCFVYRISDNKLIADLKMNDINRIGENNEIRWDYSGDFPTRIYFIGHPNFNSSGMQFYQMDVLTKNGIPTLIRDFSKDFPDGVRILNDVEGDSSSDSRYWAWQVVNATWDRLRFFTYDKKNNIILGTFDVTDVSGYSTYLPKPNMVEISPLGTKVITHYGRTWGAFPTIPGPWVNEGDGVWSAAYKASTASNSSILWVKHNNVELSKKTYLTSIPADLTSANEWGSNSALDKLYVRLDGSSPAPDSIVLSYGVRPWDNGSTIDGAYAWDLDFKNPVKVSISETHSGWSYGKNGDEWFVSENSKDDWLEARNIKTGEIMRIISYADLFEYKGSGGAHYGKFYDTSIRGWIYMSTYRSVNDVWSNNQHLMIQLRPFTENPHVLRISPTFNGYSGSYTDEGPAALSMDGRNIFSTTNWGNPNNHGEVYQIKLPTVWPDWPLIPPQNLILLK